MEARVRRLEDDFREVKLDLKAVRSDLAGVKTDLAEVKGGVNAMPTTWQLITLVFGILDGAFLIVRFGLPAAG